MRVSWECVEGACLGMLFWVSVGSAGSGVGRKCAEDVTLSVSPRQFPGGLSSVSGDTGLQQ